MAPDRAALTPMRMRTRLRSLAQSLLAFAALAGARAPAADPLQLVHTVPLPNTAGRFDHFAVDVAGKRLFVAALGNNTVEVVDLATFTRSHTLRGMSKPTGVAYLPAQRRLVVANGNA